MCLGRERQQFTSFSALQWLKCYCLMQLRCQVKCRDFWFIMLFYYLSLVKPWSYHSHDTLLFSPFLFYFSDSFCLFKHHYLHNVIQCADLYLTFDYFQRVLTSPFLVLFISAAIFPLALLFYHPFLIFSSTLSLLGQCSELLLISYSSSYFS